MHVCFAMGFPLLGREGRFLGAGGTVVMSVLGKNAWEEEFLLIQFV